MFLRRLRDDNKEKVCKNEGAQSNNGVHSGFCCADHMSVHPLSPCETEQRHQRRIWGRSHSTHILARSPPPKTPSCPAD